MDKIFNPSKLLSSTGLLSNTDKDARVHLSFSEDGKTEYLFNMGSEFDFSRNGKYFEIKPTIEIKSPTKDLMSVSGLAAYKADKFFKGVIDINMYKSRPVSVSCKCVLYQ